MLVDVWRRCRWCVYGQPFTDTPKKSRIGHIMSSDFSVCGGSPQFFGSGPDSGGKRVGVVGLTPVEHVFKILIRAVGLIE